VDMNQPLETSDSFTRKTEVRLKRCATSTGTKRKTVTARKIAITVHHYLRATLRGLWKIQTLSCARIQISAEV